MFESGGLGSGGLGYNGINGGFQSFKYGEPSFNEKFARENEPSLKDQNYHFKDLGSGYAVEAEKWNDFHQHNYPEKHKTSWGSRIDKASYDLDSSNWSYKPIGYSDATMGDNSFSYKNDKPFNLNQYLKDVDFKFDLSKFKNI